MRRLSIIGHRSAVLLGTAIATSLVNDDSFPAGGAVGDTIQRLRDPFAGMEAGTTTYTTVGSVPSQLALSGDTIVRGSAEAMPGTAYAIGIVATSGDRRRSTMATITMMALGRASDGPVAPIVNPTPTPTPTPVPTPTPTPAPTPTVYFAAATISATEGNSGTKNLVMTARRSTSSGAVTVTATFVQGTAVAADFGGNVLPGTKNFVFVDGSDTATESVTIAGDTNVESDETFGYQLVAPQGYALGTTSSLTGTILNDDVAVTPTVFFASATVSVTEGNSGTKGLVMTARRSTTSGAVNVTATFAAGTTNAEDYPDSILPDAKVFAFADGSDTAPATVLVAGDTNVESDETFSYQLVAPQGYALGTTSSLTGTILNDDVAVTPTVYFDSAEISATEGNSGTKDMVMTAKRSSTANALTVTATFIQGSAGPADFAGNALPGDKTFTFAAGSPTATATVTVSGDTDVEADDTFGYQLIAPQGYALGTPSRLTGTILNDDSGAPVYLSNPSTATTYGPAVTLDTNWQDLGSPYGLALFENAVDGSTGAYGVGGELYAYCDTNDGAPTIGLKIENMTSGRYKNCYYRSNGAWVQFSGASAVMDYGKALLREDVIRVFYDDANNAIRITVNDVLAHTIGSDAVNKGFPGGFGRFWRFRQTNGGSDRTKVTFTSDGGVPLKLLAVEPHVADRGMDMHVAYTNPDGQLPSGWDATYPDGTIVPTTRVSNARPGRAKVRIAGEYVPAKYAGKKVDITLTQRNASTVTVPGRYYATDKATYGMNIIGYPRMFNNIATGHWRGDGYGKDSYNPANAPWIDVATGDILSFEPGVSTYLLQLDPVATDSLMRLDWTGNSPVTINDPAKATTITKTSANAIEFMLKAGSLATYIAVSASTWDASSPARNIWCSEIVAAGGAYVDKTTWYAGFIRDAAKWPWGRVMDLLGTNSSHTGFADGKLTPANRRRYRRGLRGGPARLFIPTSHGSARLKLTVRAYASGAIVSQYLPNNHWYGSQGNNWSVTVTAPASSGSGSITVLGKDITVTPPPANTVQSVIDLFKTTSLMIEMFDVSYSGSASSDTVPVMAKTNLRDGIDADPSVVTVEELAQFFKLTGIEPFYNVSFNATPEFAVEAVTILWTITGKKPRVEIGNEAFNLSFNGSAWLIAWAIYRKSTEPNVLRLSIDESLYRAVPIFTALKNALGDNVITGLGSQGGNPDVTRQIVAYPGLSLAIMNEVFIAPYWYPTQDQPDDDVYFKGGFNSVNLQVRLIDEHQAILAPYGYGLHTYEAGQHSTEQSPLETAQATQERRQRSPRMKFGYGYYLGELTRVHGLGRGVIFYHYHWISRISIGSSGAWGLIEYLGQPRSDAPKMDAYLDAMDGIYPPYIRYGQSIRVIGSRVVGQMLSLDLPPAFNTSGIAIQWTADGVVIDGATGWTYAQTSAEKGKKMGVNVLLSGAKDYTTPYAYADSFTVA
ncbi:Calx-beta domain-containing protein [Sphingomonas sp. SORGH_AS_0438]|uniref:Calx-beta domain-containing protein n=1 Tax=Sphingomonas sp. SORGH_AS_0438 TaxID=3041756 RepID=UPI002859EB46|nr:Calx-beta domain-containing protein [Sphingomonas sp. SORGH_AS_0438]MDR6128041.1 hypothetical protein [Sphingomonas sp. SORGH_AS_0438]